MTCDNLNKNANAASTIPVSVITATEPKRLTKRFEISNGELKKTPGGILVEGGVTISNVEGLEGFSELLQTLQPSQALIYGLPVKAPTKITTKDKWHRSGRPDNVIPRTAEMFHWNDGPGILMLDYDPENGTTSLDMDALVSALRSAVSGLQDAEMLWWPSASSHITNSESGEEITPLRGQRLYLAVKDAKDIPRAGQAITDALWAAGFGHFAVSRSGSLLPRTIVDQSVWQTNRLDFGAGASCKAPLRQDRGKPIIVPGKLPVIDTFKSIPEPTEEMAKQADVNRATARQQKKTEAKNARDAWIEERVDQMTPTGADDATREAAREIARRAVENDALGGDFIITLVKGGETQDVTIAEVLDNPALYNGLLTLDPLEPGYNNNKVVGKLFLYGARPRLFSFAHGGHTFKLMRQLTRVELIKGQTHNAVLQTLEIMRRSPDFYDFGGALVTIDNGKIHPLDEPGLAHGLGGITQFWRLNQDGKIVLEDPPSKVTRQILSMNDRRKLKPLTAVVTAPTLRPDGTVFDKQGYDEATGFLFETNDDLCSVPSKPDKDAVENAINILLHPFLEFPLVGPQDWGVLLAALITAAVRSALPTAPGFGFDAPVQGSGKSLLASCVGALTTGDSPTVWPHTAGRDDEEVRKRLFAALRQGARALIWDNVVGTFDSAAMAAALTSGNFTDRVLGKSESISIPNRAVLLMTGNNLTLAGDMARRVLKCRIDPETDRPFSREFDLEPLSYTLEHRQEMIAAALTIVRGRLCSGDKRAPGRMASFEAWDDFVRQSVAWISREIRPGEFLDPMETASASQADDPEQEILGALLQAWWNWFGDKSLSSADLLENIKASDNHLVGERLDEAKHAKAFCECIGEFGDSAKRSSRSLGRALKYRVGRIVGGFRLEKSVDAHTKLNLWRVVKVKSR
jgi:hypothetical protein